MCEQTLKTEWYRISEYKIVNLNLLYKSRQC